jgi:hypothetical protein
MNELCSVNHDTALIGIAMILYFATAGREKEEDGHPCIADRILW